MSKLLYQTVAMLALSAGVASTGFAGQWTAAAHFGVTTGPIRNTQTIVAAPEIDPASALSALTLLLGGLAVVRGRAKK